ncbi:MAG: hypothetical protein LUC87_06735 [Clostridiales bacterium]|nr:hypothetical protein [Clostridiales bacterium]
MTDRSSGAYPAGGILLSLFLLYLAPFTDARLPYIAFLVCLYRVIRYDAAVFGTDYCVLAAVSLLFQTPGGTSLLAYLCIFAVIWQFLRGSFRADASFLVLMLLLDYLLLRMGGGVNRFVLCFSQLALLRLFLPGQTGAAVVRTSRLFCLSLLASSVYAWVFRGAPQLLLLQGAEVAAYQGSSATRFQGLFQDPNYYMALLAVGIALTIRLFANRQIGGAELAVVAGGLSVFGFLTYSKTFLVVFLALLLLFVLFQLLAGRAVLGLGTAVCAALGLAVAAACPDTPVSVVLYRLFSASGLNELTTGRAELFTAYLEAILARPSTLLVGVGLSGEALSLDPHNLFLELTYYLGVIGLALFLLYLALLMHGMGRWGAGVRHRQPAPVRYLVLLTAAALFCTLSGMFSATTYVMLFLGIAAAAMPERRLGDAAGPST